MPIMCLTATANQAVVDDTIRKLGMRDTFRFTMSFNRSNLQYEVRKKGQGKKVIEDIASIIRSKRGQTGVIYCFSQKDTETVAAALQEAIPAMRNQITFYHAKMDPPDKEHRQREWSRGNIKVIW